MNTKQIISVLVVIVIAGGVWWFLAKAPAPAPMTTPQTVQASTFNEDAQYSTIKVEYPTAPAKERAAIEAEIDKDIADFRQSVAGLDATVMPSLADGHKLEFVAGYKEYHSTDTSSYFYTIFEDTGGAHPNAYFKTFVFDKDGNRIGIKDVVGPDLTKLSQLVRADVLKQMEDRLGFGPDKTTLSADGLPDSSYGFYAEGTEPKEENFQDFVIDGDTLVIEIPPYQVAAYVMGSFEVRIPLSDINH
ncbi:MAG: DUF3298 domain-containing protein [Patescibacteria group bacterium]